MMRDQIDRALLATCALLGCMVWDIVTNIFKVRGPCFLRGHLFVLNALTVFILGFVDTEKGDAFSTADENYMEVLVDNQLRTDAARLTMCVFVGCTLPKVAMAASNVKPWSNLATLFLGFSFHIASDIYALQNDKNSKVERKAGPWFVSSGMVLSLGALSLLVLLGAVMLSGQMGRRLVRYDISGQAEIEGDSRETLRKIGISWMRVDFRKAECFACNSAFSPGAGVIVTICVVFMAAKVGCRSSLLHNNDGEGNLTFYLQCVFIVVGWILMLCRWFKAALYCANSLQKDFFIHTACSFLAPAVVVANLLCPTLVLTVSSFVVNQKFSVWNIIISVVGIVLLVPLCVFIGAVGLFWLFCFICWHVSALVMGSQFIQHLFKLDNSGLSGNGEYKLYQSKMATMNQNDKDKTDFFWIVNEKSLLGIKWIVNQNKKRGRKSKELLSIMGKVTEAEIQRLRLRDRNRHDWMGVVIGIFSAIADAEIGVDMEAALAAYGETRDVFPLDNIRLDPLNIFGIMNFHSFFKRIGYIMKMSNVKRKLKRSNQRRKSGTGPLQENRRSVERTKIDDLVGKINKLGDEMFACPFITINENTEELISEGTFNSPLVKIDECSYNDLNELGNKLRKLVGHVIISALLEALDVALKCTKQWAQDLDENLMVRAIGRAAKITAVLENLGICSEERRQAPSETGERSTDEDFFEAAWMWCELTKS